MALTTVQTELINDASPINNDYSIGDRLHYIGTGGFPSDGGDTAPSTGTDIVVSYNYAACTGASGVYTIDPPAPGAMMVIDAMGSTEVHIKTDGNFVGGAAAYSSYTALTLTTAFISIQLVGIDTSLWAIVGGTGSVAELATST